MRRIVLFLAVLAIVVLSAPAFAQEGPFWGGIRQMQRDLADQPAAMVAESMCRGHRGTGDLVEMSWCFGCKYNPDGSFLGRNPLALFPTQCRPFYRRPGSRPYVALALPRVAPMPSPEPEVGTEPETQQETAPMIVNRTGCPVRVNGRVIPPGAPFRADPDRDSVSVQSTTCALAYKSTDRGTALVCK